MWTDEIKAECKRLLEVEGLSTSQIGTELNERFKTTFTRNAICGFIHRAGLSKPRSVMRSSPRRPLNLGVPKPRVAKLTLTGPHQVVERPSIAGVVQPPQVPVFVIVPLSVDETPVTGAVDALMVLRSGRCKYGIGDTQSPSFRFCMGATGDVTRSYCPEHHALCCPPMVRRAA